MIVKVVECELIFPFVKFLAGLEDFTLVCLGELDNDLVILDQTGDSIVVADISGNEGIVYSYCLQGIQLKEKNVESKIYFNVFMVWSF